MKSLVTALDHFYQHHYVPPVAPAAMNKKKLFNLVRKRDRASILAWLARATAEQRKVFRCVMEGMHATKEGLMDKLIYEVRGTDLLASSSCIIVMILSSLFFIIVIVIVVVIIIIIIMH